MLWWVITDTNAHVCQISPMITALSDGVDMESHRKHLTFS